MAYRYTYTTYAWSAYMYAVDSDVLVQREGLASRGLEKKKKTTRETRE